MSTAAQGPGNGEPVRFDPVTGQILTGPPPEKQDDRPKRVLSPRVSQMLSPRRSSAAVGDEMKKKTSGAAMPEYTPPPKESTGLLSPRTSMLRSSLRAKKADTDAERAAAVSEAKAAVYFPGELASLGAEPVKSPRKADAALNDSEELLASGEATTEGAGEDVAVDELSGEIAKVATSDTSRTLEAVDTNVSAHGNPVFKPINYRAVGVVAKERVPMKAIGGPELENAYGQDPDRDVVAFYHDGFRMELRDLHALLTKWESKSWNVDARAVEQFFSWWDEFKNAVMEWYPVDERVFITHMETFQASLQEFDGASRSRKRLDFISAAQAVDSVRDAMLSGEEDAMDRLVPAIQTCFPALLSYLLVKEEMMTSQVKTARGSDVLKEKHLLKLDEAMARETLKCNHGALILCLYVSPLAEAERSAWVKRALPFLQARKFPSMWTRYQNHRALLK